MFKSILKAQKCSATHKKRTFTSFKPSFKFVPKQSFIFNVTFVHPQPIIKYFTTDKLTVLEQKAKFFEDAAELCLSKGDWSTAESNFITAMELSRQTNKLSPSLESKFNSGIGFSAMKTGHYEKAKLYFEKAIKVLESEPKNDEILQIQAFAYLHLAMSFHKSEFAKEAAAAAKQAVELAPKIEQQSVRDFVSATSYNNYAVYLIALHEHDQALTNINKSLDILEKGALGIFHNLYTECIQNAGKLLTNLGRTAEAEALSSRIQKSEDAVQSKYSTLGSSVPPSEDLIADVTNLENERPFGRLNPNGVFLTEKYRAFQQESWDKLQKQ